MTHRALSDLSPLRLALLVERARAQLEGADTLSAEPVAVIGMGCRFPGADGPEAYWSLLREGGDAIVEVPEERWSIERFFDPDPSAPGHMNSRWGGFVAGLRGFDADFFAISPREAERMDPRQRMVLEVGWEAFESAGLTREQLRGSATGVFIGVSAGDFAQLQLADLDGLDAYTATGAANSIVANRLSFWLDLRGPSMALDTACSSSLVAIHLACDALRSRSCDRAVAGGVNAILQPELSVSLAKWGALAPDGRCKAFDSRADGFVRGEGCGMVVLRRLADALRDGDPVLAVIRGSAVNQDGRSAGLTAPNLVSQRAVLREALARAQVRPEQIGMLEAHGTGTSLGDPIEAQALSEVLGAQPQQGAAPLVLGSVKANIGHLEAAAGVAGFIKCVLALVHGEIPALVHFRRLNPNIDLEGTRLQIPRERRPWPRGADRRLAGVSAFGMGGTNAHLILEEAPEPRALAREASQLERPALLLLSAAGEPALEALARAHRDRLSPATPGGAGEREALADLTFTAARRRSHLAHRLAIVGADAATIAAGLDALLAGRPSPRVARGLVDGERRPKLALVFSPHGSQWAGMGHELWTHEPIFRERLEQVDAALRPHLGWSVAARLSAAADAGDDRWLDRTAEIQPALFALQLALAALLERWGLHPDLVVGHSVGEVAAACFVGALSLEDAARVAVARSRLLGTLEGEGAMAVVELPLAEAERFAAARGLAVAVSNSPRFTVLAGAHELLTAAIAELEARGLYAGFGVANVASHTAEVASLVTALREALVGLQPSPARLPILSSARPDLAAPTFDVEHWVCHLTEPVRFYDALAQLIAGGCDHFVEIAPHPVLRTAIQESLTALAARGQVYTSLQRRAPAREALLETLAKLHVEGVPLALDGLFDRGRCVALPAYPWQRRELWRVAEARSATPASTRSRADHPLLGERLAVAGARIWQAFVDDEHPRFARDHQVHGAVILPGAAFMDMALAAGDAHFGHGRAVLESLRLLQACVLDGRRMLQTTLESIDEGRARLRIHSRAVETDETGETGETGESERRWTLHVEVLCRRGEAEGPRPSPALALDLPRSIGADEHLERMATCGVHFGPSFRGLQEIRGGRGLASARLEPIDPALRRPEGHVIHPALLDLGLQLIAAAVDPERAGLYLPTAVAGLRRHGDPSTAAAARVRLGREDAGELVADVELLDDAGDRVLVVEGFRARRVDAPSDERWDDALLLPRWISLPSLPLPSLPRPQRAESAPRRWLIVGEGRGIAATLAERAADFGVEVRRASLEPATSIDAALDRLFAPGEIPDALIHLGALEPDLDETRLIAPTLGWTQALIRRAWSTRLWLCTLRAQAVEAAARVDPLAALSWGFARSLALEQRGLRCARVDLDALDETARALLLAELLADGDEDQLAHRGGRRFALRLQAAPRLGLGAAAPIRTDGAYLITGGLGGLGLTLARWLLAQGAGELILIGRSGRVADPEALAALRAGGCPLHIVTGDAADPQLLRAAIERAGLPLRGVLHCAVVLDDGVVTELDPARFAAVIRPKLGVAAALDRACADLDLDFFALFSSAASLIGAPGQANYAAANAALDALAADRRARGLPGLSINWGPWASVGLAAGDEARFAARGMTAMAPAIGTALLARLLTGDEAQVGVLRLDLRRWQLIDPQALAAPLFAALRTELALEDAPSLRAELAALAPSQRRQTLEHRLAEQIIAVLRLDLDGADLDPRRPFGELGFDSLTALELRNRLEARLELSLPATLIWTYPNLAALGQAVADALDLDFADPLDLPPLLPLPTLLPTPTRPSTALDDAEAGELEALLTGLEALSDAELDTILEPSTRGDS